MLRIARSAHHLDVIALEIVRIAVQPRHDLVLHDARRDIPVRAEHDVRHLVGEDRRRILFSSRDHLHVEDDAACLESVQPERRDVHEQVPRAKVIRHPTPPIHVQLDQGDALRDRESRLVGRQRLALRRERTVMRELRAKALIRGRGRRERLQRLLHPVVGDRGLKRGGEIDRSARRTPSPIDILRPNGAAREVPAVFQVGVGELEVDVGGTRRIERLARARQCVNIVFSRIEPLVGCAANGTNERIHHAPRTFAVAPDQLIPVPLVEASLLLPEAACLRVGTHKDRACLRGDRRTQLRMRRVRAVVSNIV